MAAAEKKASGVVIKPCTCASPFQDSKYGAGNRVFTVGVKDVTCTVCGRKG